MFIYLFGVLRHFQHCTGHISTGSWKGRGNQYIQFVRVLYCKLPTNGKQLPAFPLEAMLGIEPRPQRWEARVLPLYHHGPYSCLSFVSYNSQGSGTGRKEYISKLIEDNDFTFVQEHWLSENQFDSYKTDLNKCGGHCVSGMSGKDFLQGRPYGGCAILWKNDILLDIKPVTLDSSRACAVKFSLKNELFLVCNIYIYQSALLVMRTMLKY